MDGINLEDLITANLGQSLDEASLDIEQLDLFINGVVSDNALLQQQQQQQQQLLQHVYPSTSAGVAVNPVTLPHVQFGGCGTSVSATDNRMMRAGLVPDNETTQWYDQQRLPSQPINGNVGYNIATTIHQQSFCQQPCAVESVDYSQQVATPGCRLMYTQATNDQYQQPYQLSSYNLHHQPHLPHSVPATVASATYLPRLPQDNQPQQHMLRASPNDVYIPSGEQLHATNNVNGIHQLPVQQLQQQQTTTAAAVSSQASPVDLENVAIASLSQQLSLLVGAILQNRLNTSPQSTAVPCSQNELPSSPNSGLNWSQQTVNDCSASMVTCNQLPLTSPAALSTLGPYNDLGVTVFQNGGNVQPQTCHVPGTEVDLTTDSGDWIDDPLSSSAAAGVYRHKPEDDAVSLNCNVNNVFPYTPPESGGSDISSPHSHETDVRLTVSPSCDVKTFDPQLPILQQVTLAGQSGRLQQQQQQQQTAARPSTSAKRSSAVGQQQHLSVAVNGVLAEQNCDLSPNEHNTPVGRQTKKRKLTSTSSNAAANVNKKNKELDLKCEVVECSEDDDPINNDADMTSFCGTQVMQWIEHQPTKWVTLLDETGNAIAPINFRVEADKGFNFQFYDDAFVCQKKNHFQLTVQTSYSGSMAAKYIKHPGTDVMLPIDSFHVNLHGIKMDIPTYQINIEQSSADRTRHSLEPVSVQLEGNKISKAVIQRLHFSETTANNMRKRGRPNPDQRYFQLVVSLYANHNGNQFIVSSFASDKIIVRVSLFQRC